MKIIPDKFIPFLKRKINLDIIYFLKGGIYSTLQQITGIICGLGVSYIYGHFVPKPVFGEFNYILSVLTIVFPLCIPGIDTALTRSVGLGYDKSLITGTKVKFKYSFLGIPALIGFAIVNYLQNKPAIALTLFTVAFIFPFLNSFTSYPSFLIAKKMFKFHAISASYSSVFFLMLTYVSIRLSPNTFGITTGYLLALIIPAIITYLYLLRFITSKSKSDSKLVPYGKFLTGLSVSGWVTGGLGNLVLSHSAGNLSLATYSVAERFMLTAQKNFQAFYKPASAKLASQSPVQHLDVLKKHWLKLILMGLLISMVAWVFAPFLINIFFTSTYSDSILYAKLLSLSLVVMPINWVLADIIVFQKQKVIQILNSIIIPVLKIILYIILIPKYGILGLVIVVLIERFISVFIQLFGLLKFSHNTK